MPKKKDKDQKEKEAMKESVDEAMEEGKEESPEDVHEFEKEMNKISKNQDKAIVTKDELQESQSIGLEDVKQEDLPIPTLRLIQKTSDPVTTKDGDDVDEGAYYHSALREAWDEPEVIFLKAKPIEMYSKYDDTDKRVWAMLGVLGEEYDYQPFMLYTNPSSNRAAASFVQNVISSKRPIFSYKVSLRSKLIKFDKGNAYIMVFKDYEPIKDKGEFEYLKELALRFSKRSDIETVEDEV